MGSNLWLLDKPHVVFPVMKPMNSAALQLHSQLQQAFRARRPDSPHGKMCEQTASSERWPVILPHHFKNRNIFWWEQEKLGADFTVLLMAALAICCWSVENKLVMPISVREIIGNPHDEKWNACGAVVSGEGGFSSWFGKKRMQISTFYFHPSLCIHHCFIVLICLK